MSVVMSPSAHPRHGLSVAGHQGRDRVEILAVGLDGVRRRLTGAAVGEEGGEPLRSHRGVRAAGERPPCRQYFMDNDNYP